MAVPRYFHYLLLIQLLFISSCATQPPTSFILDQELIGLRNESAVISADQDVGQGFSVNMTGILTNIDIQVFHLHKFAVTKENLLIDIVPLFNSMPPSEIDANSLISIIMSPADISTKVGSFVNVDISSHELHVSAGDSYAIVLRAEEKRTFVSPYAWAHDKSGSYKDGDMFTRIKLPEEPEWSRSELVDFGFRTYIQPIPPK